MNVICKIVGHKWDKSDKYKQQCKRRYCFVTRWLTVGRQQYTWKTTDLDKIKP
jgi:lipoate-protein ligase A